MAKGKTYSLPSALQVGRPYLFTTPTRDFFLGRVVSVDGPFMVTITDYSWVADTGRMAEFLRAGVTDATENEPAPDGHHKQLQFVAWDNWPHPLLREVLPR
jgi:hypothetical protein